MKNHGSFAIGFIGGMAVGAFSLVTLIGGFVMGIAAAGPYKPERKEKNPDHVSYYVGGGATGSDEARVKA